MNLRVHEQPRKTFVGQAFGLGAELYARRQALRQLAACFQAPPVSPNRESPESLHLPISSSRNKFA
jgi:hypothetical protein